jgi:hypothetical protein
MFLFVCRQCFVEIENDSCEEEKKGKHRHPVPRRRDRKYRRPYMCQIKQENTPGF